MQAGEIFVKLGIRGADKAGKELQGVGKSLGEVKTSALALKASIVGILYGLEQLMSNSMKIGTELTNFAATTGMSAQQLQKWQYASKLAGVSAEATASSFKNVQDSMTKMALGKGAPEGMAFIEKYTKFDRTKANDTMYVMKQLDSAYQQMRKAGVDINIANQAVSSFGAGAMLPGFSRGMYTEKNFAKAPKYSEKDISNLNKTAVAWELMAMKFQMAVGKLTAKEGLPLVKDIGKAGDALIKLIDSLAKFSKQAHIFEGIGKIFEGWGYIFDGLAAAADKVAAIFGIFSAKNPAEYAKTLLINGSKAIGDTVSTGVNDLQNAMLAMSGAPERVLANAPAPLIKNNTGQQKTNNQNNNISQTFNISGADAMDAKKAADVQKKAIRDAHRQIPNTQRN